VPNHDGEDSENWDAFYFPVGDARLAMLSVVDLLEGQPPRRGEHWDENLLP
jgi:guanylate kinase